MEYAHRVAIGIVGAEAVGADQLGEMIGVVGGRALDAAHLGEADLTACFCELPGGFGTGEAAADDMDIVHEARHSRADRAKEPWREAVVGDRMTIRLFTIGYEGITQSELICALEHAGVTRLIDVRALPLSRRPGFSKTPLRTALAGYGIEYVHLKALGTPPEGREAARRGRHDEMAVIYRGQLGLPEAIVAVERMRVLVTEAPSALLCFEREPAHCHRAVLIEEALPEAEVEHLFAGV